MGCKLNNSEADRLAVENGNPYCSEKMSLLAGSATGMLGLAVGAVGCRSWGCAGILFLVLALLTVGIATLAQFGQLLLVQYLVNLQAGAVHLFGYFGTEVTFTVEEREELFGVVAILLGELV